MARTVTIKPADMPTPTDALEIAGAPSDGFPEALSDAADFDPLGSILDEVGAIRDDDSKIIVWRANSVDGRKVDAFLYECAPSDFSITDLQSRYGGGTYRIRGFRFDPAKQRRMMCLNRMIIIEQAKEGTAPAPHSGPAFDPSPLITAMTAGFQKLGELIVTATPKPQDRKSFLEEMLTLKTLFSSGEKPGMSPSDMVQLLQSGIELGRSSSGETDAMAEMTRGIMPLLGRWAETQAVQPQLPIQNPVPLPAPNSATIPAVNPAQETAPMNPQQKMIAQGLSMLVAQAARDADPSIYGDLLIDQAGEDFLSGFLNSPDWYQKLCEFNPQIGKHQAWFLELRDYILTSLQTDAQTPEAINPLAPKPDASVKSNKRKP